MSNSLVLTSSRQTSGAPPSPSQVSMPSSPPAHISEGCRSQLLTPRDWNSGRRSLSHSPAPIRGRLIWGGAGGAGGEHNGVAHLSLLPEPSAPGGDPAPCAGRELLQPLREAGCVDVGPQQEIVHIVTTHRVAQGVHLVVKVSQEAGPQVKLLPTPGLADRDARGGVLLLLLWVPLPALHSLGPDGRVIEGRTGGQE